MELTHVQALTQQARQENHEHFEKWKAEGKPMLAARWREVGYCATRPVLIEAWCPWCRKLHLSNDSLAEGFDLLDDSIGVAYDCPQQPLLVNCGEDEEPGVVSEIPFTGKAGF